MIREVKFESQDRRIKQILACLNAHGIASIEEANETFDKIIDYYKKQTDEKPISIIREVEI